MPFMISIYLLPDSFMTAMKKKMAIIAVLVIAFVTSYKFCGTGQNDAEIDSIKIEEYTAVLSNKIDWDSVAGTYCGVLRQPFHGWE